MFWIKINNKKLQLPKSFKVDLIIENPMTLNDRIPVPYTTSFDVILSDYNKKLLANPHRINKKTQTREYDNVRFGVGAFQLYAGSLITREISGVVSANFQAADNLAQLKKNLNEIELGEYTFGSFNKSGRTSFDFNVGFGEIYKNLIFSAAQGNEDFTPGPIKVDTSSFPTTFIDDVLNFVHSTAGQDLFFNLHGFPFNYIFTLESIGGTTTKSAHGIIFPQIKASAFLDKLLGSVIGIPNPFKSNGLEKVVLTSHHHPKLIDGIINNWMGVLLDNDYPGDLDPAEELILKLKSFQPATPANEILKSLLNVACATLYRIDNNFHLKLNRDVFRSNIFDDWDKLLISKPVLSFLEAQNYSYGYADFTNEANPNDPDFILPTVNDLLWASVNPDTGEQTYYIQTTKQTIKKKLSPPLSSGSPDEFTYEVINSGLKSSDESDGYNITSQLSPMKMSIADFIGEYRNKFAPDRIKTYAPLYSGDRTSRYRPHIMLYHNYQLNLTNIPDFPDVGLNKPYLSYHNYDAFGNRIHDISLDWEGPDGLLENFHKEFKEWIESERLKMIGLFLLTPQLIKNLDISKKFNVRNRLWWIQKITVPFTEKRIEPAEVELIEASLHPEAPASGSGSASAGSGGIGSGSAGGGIPGGDGICYTITIDTTVFDPVEDDFDIIIQRPGESQILQNYNMFDQLESGSDILIFVCSETVPAFIQDGGFVASVPGVSVTSGGACSLDSECVI